MSEPTPSFSMHLYKFIDWTEKILLTILFIGVILYKTDYRSQQKSEMLIIASLTGLAVLFFLLAYRPLRIERLEDEKLGMMDLLCTSIVPKVLWISNAVLTVGVLFYFFEAMSESYHQTLMIGCLTVGMGIIILGIGIIQGVKHLKILMPILYRSIPLSIAGIYLLIE
jgi:hypothetical protein